ncbi:formate dehydrogenase accessory protein FdhD [Rhodobacter capsulatus SB 1003]|uniref:Formate dehydrogenase accessory protein FdhD n=1 Tax=Rhodobacter capsulatus (strain ATCC BAA-309 / NBRC 16581 / SB1003) TaxID=272942 RepID=D5AQG9_RHOCB|nr:formate dehydrogenase accessory sulfurtransferase FdhD [Rhodobacter capsulatus]ADE86758.1 formate dehydrogenase accessory protein FdhD [Rhodobacter capsulatus SB 1003]
MSLPAGAVTVPLPGGARAVLAEEVPVALVFDGVTQAVMMASPVDLEDFLLGFALTEGMIADRAELLRHEVVRQPQGIELRGWLAAPAGQRFAARRRAMAGPVGCGLCGLDSLAAVLRPLPRAPRGGAPPPLADGALAALRAGQSLQDAVRSVHAAGFWDGAQMRALREDVGRHNALDKLAGALAGQGIDAAAGALVLTSRLSVDLVQKAAMIGARVLIAPSAPTALAVAEAQAAGLALIARGPDGPTLYTETEAE